MDLLTSFLNDMRARTSPGSHADVTKAIMRFHEQTDNAFLVNYDIRVPADKPSTIRNRYAPLIGCPDARLVFALRRDYAGVKTRFHRVMSGVVVKYPEWKLLSIMPENPDTTMNFKYVSEHMGDYDVYPVKDTTMVSLYYDDCWRVSTYNGIDASDRTWLGEKSYMEVVRELCGKHPKFSFDNLCKAHTYILGFHHHDFHPLVSEEQSIELIYSMDIGDIARGPIYDEDIGLPAMRPLDITLETIMAKRASALMDYRTDNNNKCFGFVLRRKTGTRGATRANDAAAAAGVLTDTSSADRGKSPQKAATGASQRNKGQRRAPKHPCWLDMGSDPRMCDIVIESKLMSFIRRTVYDIPKLDKNPVTIESPQDRVEFICLRAILTEDESIRVIFPKLFPQYAGRCKLYEEFLVTIKRALIGAIGCNGGDITAGRPRSDDGTDGVVAALYDRIVKHKLNINSAQTDSILEDYVRNAEHIAIYYAYYKKMRS